MVNYWRFRYVDYVYRTVTCMRSLGHRVPWPMGARTFREFLKMVDEKFREWSARGCESKR